MQTGTRRGLSKYPLDLQRVGLYANMGDPVFYAKTYYFATDDPVPNTGTLYYSDGTTWTRISTTKTELARAELTSTSASSSGNTYLDVAGFSIAFTLATARAVALQWMGFLQQTAADYMGMAIRDGSNNTVASSTSAPSQSAANVDIKMPPAQVVKDLTAGTYTYKISIACPVTGNCKIHADTADFRSQLTAVAL